MLLKDVRRGMTAFLKNSCHHPYEIYDSQGELGVRFKPDMPCDIIMECSDYIVVVVSDQILIFYLDNKHIVDAVRYDATPANIAGVLHIINKETDIFEDDSFCEAYVRKGGC